MSDLPDYTNRDRLSAYMTPEEKEMRCNVCGKVLPECRCAHGHLIGTGECMVRRMCSNCNSTDLLYSVELSAAECQACGNVLPRRD